MSDGARLTHFRASGSVIMRFTVRQTVRGASGWAVLLAAYIASKSIGIVKAYPTTASRAQLAKTFSHNSGLEILLGPARQLDTIAGFVAWNGVQIMTMVGAIWGLLLATKTLRGNEESGRWELLRSSPVTARQATVNVLAGLAASLTIFFVIIAGVMTLIGQTSGVGIGPSQALFFALTITAGTGMFMLIGAFASQLMPTRGRAAGLAAIVFAVSFLLRATGDITTAHWLITISPIGWIEKLQPLVGSQPLWLIPIVSLSAALLGVTLWLAGRRDLEASIVADRPESPPRLRLLNSLPGLALRIHRANLMGWLAGVGLLAFFYGALTKTAIQALGDSAKLKSPALTHLFHESNLASAKAFLGVVFLILLLVMLAYAASVASAVRRDEANGYFDNLLVRPISRWQLIGNRMMFGVMSISLAALTVSFGVWLGVTPLHLGVGYASLFQASINIWAPAILAFGVGLAAFGYRPRLTAAAAYGVLVWSFLIDMLSSGLHLNHWLLDSSILNQISLAPAANPRWVVLIMMVVIGLVLMTAAAIDFAHRDIVNE